MEQTLERLQRIEKKLEGFGDNLLQEERIYRAEKEERERLGLHGDAAVKHYNEWMARYDMSHLMVKED